MIKIGSDTLSYPLIAPPPVNKNTGWAGPPLSQLGLLTAGQYTQYGLIKPNFFWSLANPQSSADNLSFPDQITGIHALLSFQAGHGVTPGVPPIIEGDPSATAVMISSSSRPVMEGSGNIADNSGAAAMSWIVAHLPRVTRSGAARIIRVLSKCSNADQVIQAGWNLCEYWDTVGTRIALLFQGATLANRMLVVGNSDLINFNSHLISAAKSATKLASGVKLYIDGIPETLTVISDTLGSDTATNGNDVTIGGISGNQTYLSNLGDDGIVSCAGIWTSQLTDAQMLALGQMARATRKQPITGGTRKKIGIYLDGTGDVDDYSALLVAIACHLRGEVEIVFVVTNGSNDYSPVVVEGLLSAAGLDYIPIGAYKGGGRDITNTAQWSTPLAAFGITGRTRAHSHYQTPLSLARTIFTIKSNVQLVSVGPMDELSTFLNAPADGISGLTGIQMITAAGQPLVTMSGLSAGGIEFNLQQSPTAGKNIFDNWPTPIFSATKEVENNTSVAIPGNAAVDFARAIYESHKHVIEGSNSPDWYRDSAYDVVAMLYACRGLAGGALSISNANQKNTVDGSTGSNSYSGSGTHNVIVSSGSAVIRQCEALIGEAVAASRDGWALAA